MTNRVGPARPRTKAHARETQAACVKESGSVRSVQQTSISIEDLRDPEQHYFLPFFGRWGTLWRRLEGPELDIEFPVLVGEVAGAARLVAAALWLEEESV